MGDAASTTQNPAFRRVFFLLDRKNKQTGGPITDNYVPGWQIGVNTPCSCKAIGITRRKSIEERYFDQIVAGQIAKLQNPQPGCVVGLEYTVAEYVQVVVRCDGCGFMCGYIRRGIEIRDVEDVRPRRYVEAELVQLIAYQEKPVILGQPTLMDKTELLICRC